MTVKILLIISIFVISYVLMTCCRIELAFRERIRMITWVNSDDVSYEENMKRRAEYLDGVSYAEMIFQFWKPIKSFYPHLHKKSEG